MVVCRAGIAVYLTQEVINNAFVDLDLIPCEGGGIPLSAYSKASNGPLLQPFQKKRKHAGTTASLEEDPDRVDLEVGVATNATPLSVKIAALEAIETLLTVVCVKVGIPSFTVENKVILANHSRCHPLSQW